MRTGLNDSREAHGSVSDIQEMPPERQLLSLAAFWSQLKLDSIHCIQGLLKWMDLETDGRC